MLHHHHHHSIADVGIVVTVALNLSHRPLRFHSWCRAIHKTNTPMKCYCSEVIAVMFSLLPSQRSFHSHRNQELEVVCTGGEQFKIISLMTAQLLFNAPVSHPNKPTHVGVWN